ncbi:MAG: hypothetical protein JW891_11490 [Candidatus Lokiarchaeota archaeon]|nr:hypothetical protein [Candidatus Lokiarchaeota archaeon]
MLGTLLFVPIIARNGNCNYQIGEQSLVVTPRSYVEWNVTECHNYGMWHNHAYRYSSVNDKIRFTFIEEGYFTDYDTIEDYPCIVAKLDYYFSSINDWRELDISSTYLIYDPDDKSYFSIETPWGFWDPYLLFVFPSTIDLNSLIYSSFVQEEYFLHDYDNYHINTNSINLTNSDGSYNYMELRLDGIVNRWEYRDNWSDTQISVSYLGQGNLQDSSESIPFGTGVFIGVGICVIGVVIVVHKKRLTAENL